MDQIELYIAACAECAAAGQSGRNARQWLQEISTSSKPYQLCIAVIGRASTVDERMRSSIVFQCLTTILHALEREWSILSRDEIGWLQTQLSGLIVAPWAHGAVLNQAAYTLAVIQKRTWSVAEEDVLATKIVSDLERFLSDPNLQSAGLALAQNLLSEFSSQHGSTLNLTWESHITCHRSFERTALRPLFKTILRFLKSQPISQLTAVILNVMVTVLSWSFEESLASDKLALRCMIRSANAKPDSTQIVLKPGPTWRTILLGNDHNLVQIVSNVHSTLMQSSVANRKSALRLARHVLIHLASLQGSIFPVNDDDACLLRFVGTLCNSILQILSQIASSPSLDGEAVLDACVLIQRLINCHGINRIFDVGAGGTFLDTLANLTLELVPTGASSSTSTDTWTNESFDLILDCWTAIIAQDPNTSIALQRYTDLIFQRYFRFKIETAHLAATDEEDEQFYRDESRITFNDEQFVCIALLARVSAQSALPLLTDTLNHLTSSPLTDERHECICISVTLLINLLADPYAPGEVNTIPKLILQCPVSTVINAIVSLFSLVHNTVQHIKSESLRSQLSPFAVQTLISAMHSFCCTYLTFDPNSYAKLHVEVPGEFENFLVRSVPDALDLALQLIHAIVFVWQTEIEAGVLCGSLLQALSSSKKLRERLPHCPTWPSLIASFDSCISSSPPCALPSDILRRICHGVTKVALLNSDMNSYWTVLQGHIQRLSSGNAPHSVDVALDLLNGIAKCSGRVSVEKSFPFIMSSLEVIIQRCQSTDVLELCVTLALGHLPVLDQQHSNVFFACCLAVIRAFSMSGLAALGSNDDDILDQGSKDIENLLTLLHHCTAKDLFDFGPDVVTNGADAAFAGLCALLPLFSPSALVHFPAICSSLYELLSSLVVTSPDKIVEMPPETVSALMAAIEFSLHGSVTSSVQVSGVNALKAIADYATNIDSKRRPLPPSFRQSIPAFQRPLLGLLLFESISDTLFEPLADCLQPLIKSDPVAFERLASNFINECSDEQIRNRLQNGFRLLLEGPPDATDQQRRGRFFFRQNCIAFVQQCRPFLQRK